MANCKSNTYLITHTDSRKTSYIVPKSSLITDKLDIALVGKTRKEYGEIFNENILHLLENFSSPEDASNPGNPDLDVTYGELLGHPVVGQIWYNSTESLPYICVENTPAIIWQGMEDLSRAAGNSGVISHGQYLPRPINPKTGYQYEYSECAWVVSPFHSSGVITIMQCYTSSTGLVFARYKVEGSLAWVNGYANYQIIGIKDS